VAAGAPEPLLIALENGHTGISVDRVDAPPDYNTLYSLVREVGASVKKGELKYKTIVFDSVTALERLIHKIAKTLSKTHQEIAALNYVQKDLKGLYYVFVAANNVVEKKNVILGREYNGLTEVTEGLLATDLLITSGYDGLNEGDAVKIKE
jgi:multidrug efflux pump subunit AcrA (membrane-fusion protein)